MSDVEETLQRLKAQKGVVGVIVANSAGAPIKTTLDNATTTQYASLISQLTEKTRTTVRDLDPSNDLTFLRIRTKKHEVMVSSDKGYLLIVLQNPPE
ncbi:dynein light chain roadblock-type 2-like [Ornithodoros turicata]|uniref:dynein light chain roadblock-type 2-like n=1 Tax=Ornithodoros turicata TaxID=34597 RepID=UPI0031392EC9